MRYGASGASLLKGELAFLASRPGPEEEGREASVTCDVGGRVVDEQRDREGNEQGVEHGESRSAQREPDERTKAHCEEERRVPGGCDRRLRQVEPVAEIADDGAGTAADGL